MDVILYGYKCTVLIMHEMKYNFYKFLALFILVLLCTLVKQNISPQTLITTDL